MTTDASLAADIDATCRLTGEFTLRSGQVADTYFDKYLFEAQPALLDRVAALTVAAFVGNVVGYEIGRKLGPPLYERDGRIIKQKYFDQTTAFFDKHGNKALVIGRFVPFVRTYITVVAGVTRMDRARFFVWSLVGAVLWVASICLLGYFLGDAFPGLGESIDKLIIVILAFSLVPIAYEWWRHKRTNAPGAEIGEQDGGPDRDISGRDVDLDR